MELLSLAPAAKRLGINSVTLRLWADAEKVLVTWVGCECRFSSAGIDALNTGRDGRPPARERRQGLYVRVSGSTGQESSLAAHGAELEVLRPKASGGREELPEDFISLVTTFAGRLCGLRSAAARRLLAESGQCPQAACEETAA
jgi:predicted site-specific integrase-resolvase